LVEPNPRRRENATDPPPENQAEFNQWWRFAILDDFTTLNDGMPGGKSPDKLSKP